MLIVLCSVKFAGFGYIHREPRNKRDFALNTLQGNYYAISALITSSFYIQKRPQILWPSIKALFLVTATATTAIGRTARTATIFRFERMAATTA